MSKKHIIAVREVAQGSVIKQDYSTSENLLTHCSPSKQAEKENNNQRSIHGDSGGAAEIHSSGVTICKQGNY